MTSVSLTSKIGSRSAGTATVAYPAPARIAASEAMHTAPVSPREPPITSTSPDVNFVEPASRRGASARTSSPMSPPATGAGAAAGMPIGATRRRPVRPFPGSIQWPSFAAWKVTVAVARTAAPAASPVAASTPEATSAATTGAPHPLIAAIAASAGARAAPAKPVPKIASTTAPLPASAVSSSPSPVSRQPAPSRSRLAAASPRSSPAGHKRSASTSNPSRRSLRAATSPSPPLFPLPQTTRMGPSRATSAAISATAAPAASISSSEGIPCSSIAQRSAARIPSAS